jgi:L-type amino acid transporter 6
MFDRFTKVSEMSPSDDEGDSNFENSPDDERGEDSHLIERPTNDGNVSTPDRYPVRASSDNSVHSARDRAALGDTRQPPRSLSFLSCLALVVGLQIGSGIFSAPAAVRSHVGSIWLALLAWLLAGILAATGAASFVQLGTLVPDNGGIPEYVRYAYGDFFGFSSAWAWIFVSRPLAMAMVSLIFAEYLFKAMFPDDAVSLLGLRAASILAITLITLFNSMGTRVGTGIGNVFLVLKVLGLASIAIAGTVAVLFGSRSSSDGTNETVHAFQRNSIHDTKRDKTDLYNGVSDFWTALGGFVDAVLSAVFAYGGWESVSIAPPIEFV